MTPPDYRRRPPLRYGRLDAVDAIVNEVYYHAVTAADLISPIVGAKLANAPVSYPFLWDTPQHDFVEWLGIAKNGGPLDVLTLSRNVGEVLGVFGDFAIPEDPSLLHLGYSSSVRILDLGDLENLLKALWSPQWPADFPPIDQNAAAGCTALPGQLRVVPRPDRPDRPEPQGHRGHQQQRDRPAGPRAISSPGRDRPGKLNGVNVNFVPFTAKIPAIADADIDALQRGHRRDHLAISSSASRRARPGSASAALARTGVALAVVHQGAKYKTRPLNGIWATAPYLHNGSVPNLDALLQPAANRPTSFSIGVRTYDPMRVGYQTESPAFPGSTSTTRTARRSPATRTPVTSTAPT